MVKLAKLMVLLAIGSIVLAVAGCKTRVEYRYRLTVAVQTPNGVRTGSTVIEVVSERRSASLRTGHCDGVGVQPYRTSVRGQAAIVDLGDGRSLYALLEGPSGWGTDEFPRRAFQDEFGIGLDCPTWGQELRRVDIMKRERGPNVLRNMPRRRDGMAILFPVLARFGNANDPRSIEVLDRHNLARTYGPGYRLIGVRIEITDDPVTEGIENRLPWLRTQTGYLQPYSTHSPDRMDHPERVLTAEALLLRPQSD